MNPTVTINPPVTRVVTPETVTITMSREAANALVSLVGLSIGANPLSPLFQVLSEAGFDYDSYRVYDGGGSQIVAIELKEF